MKTTKTRITKLTNGTYLAEICDDEDGSVLEVGVGATEVLARADACYKWRVTVEFRSG